MKNTLHKIFKFSKSFFEKLSDDNVFNLAASLAYYAVFSLAPFLFILINALGLLFDEVSVRNAIFDGLADLIGSNGAEQLKVTLINIGITDAGWLNNVIGILILIFTATTIFATIQNGLNYIFRVKAKSSAGIIKFFKTRLIAFAIIMGIAFIALLSLVLNGLAVLFSDYLVQLIPQLHEIFAMLNNFLLPYVISVILFAVIFRFLPDATASWKDLLIGSAFTGLLFAFGRYLIGFYIGKSDIATVYDAAGSLMVIFVWMYYSSLIFYIGAVFTVLFAEEFGNGLVTEKNSVRFIQKEITVQKDID